MEWQVEYYKKENGKIPVLEYLLTLNAKMRAKAFSEIELLENMVQICVSRMQSRLREKNIKICLN